ncbi:MAG: ATPase [Tenericutes bacterium 4572_104]|nr:MAG: ATPase [Tenericutes bacterium 4572_104]
MKYIFAYDGGGTKTRLNVIDLLGNIHFDKTTSGCNVSSSGDLEFKRIIEGLFKEAKNTLNLNDTDILYISLGLSGADLEEDYKHLNKLCQNIFKEIYFFIKNDAWIILRSGLVTPYGAVCICGTGTNSAAINKDGKEAILRSLSYILGTYGGGLDIAREALHYAFRASELTYKDTVLRIKIPKLFQVKNMEEVIPLFYPKRTIDKKTFGKITGLVINSAKENDEVSIMILKDIASNLAKQTTGVIKQLEMEKEKVPVVIGGRVFQSNCSVFINTFEEVLKEEVKEAYIIKPKFNPVIGAYLLALDRLGIKQSQEIENNLLKSGGKL